jgi:hypothetical protein
VSGEAHLLSVSETPLPLLEGFGYIGNDSQVSVVATYDIGCGVYTGKGMSELKSYTEAIRHLQLNTSQKPAFWETTPRHR